MGFSLYFMRMKNDQQLDVDRDAIVSFLGQRGLQVSPLSGHLVDGAGQALKFDGGYTDLTLDQLDQGNRSLAASTMRRCPRPSARSSMTFALRPIS